MSDADKGALQPIAELAAEFYGPNATVGQRKLLYRLCAEGKLRHVKLGRKVMAIRGVTKAELLAQSMTREAAE